MLPSKAIEKVMNGQIKYLLPIFYIFTETWLAYINDKIFKGFIEKLLTGMILVGLQKAFNTTNHINFLKRGLHGDSQFIRKIVSVIPLK